MSDSLTRRHKGAPLGTEEDGVDEAGSTTQSPFITTPQLLDSDPDVDGHGAVIDNSSMSSSRTRSGGSRSGSTGAGASRTQATPRADANGTSAKGEAAAEPDSETAKPAAAKPAAKPAKPVPMPADGIGSTPSFTPAATASPSLSVQAARPAPSAPSSPSSPSTQSSSSTQSSPGSSYPQPSSSYPQQSAAYTQPNYSRSSWASTPDAPTAAVTADSAGFASSATANGNRGGPTAGGFSSTAAGAAAGLSGAAAGLGGAAAGLASSVTSAFRGGPGPKAKSAPAPKVSVRRSSKRQAMLTLSRMEPWSVMKFSFVASVVAFIILFVAVAVLYLVLSALGVFTSLENQVASITSAKNTAGTDISHWFSASLILGWTAMLGALNIVLITALSTIGSVVYNLIAKTVGGIEVTLRETD
jgi:hypothetical protein